MNKKEELINLTKGKVTEEKVEKIIEKEYDNNLKQILKINPDYIIEIISLLDNTSIDVYGFDFLANTKIKQFTLIEILRKGYSTNLIKIIKINPNFEIEINEIELLSDKIINEFGDAFIANNKSISYKSLIIAMKLGFVNYLKLILEYNPNYFIDTSELNFKSCSECVNLIGAKITSQINFSDTRYVSEIIHKYKLNKSILKNDIIEKNLLCIIDNYFEGVHELEKLVTGDPRDYSPDLIYRAKAFDLYQKLDTAIKVDILKEKKIGWDDIALAFETIYPNQEPLSYGTLIKYNVGGKDPLDAVNIYNAYDASGEYYHFVTCGFSEIYEKENDNNDISGFGFELTYKLRKNNQIDTEELTSVVAILQGLARYIYQTKKVFKPYEYLYTGQEEGMDNKHQSKLVGFITVPDNQLPIIYSINGEIQFIQLIGMTNGELKSIINKEKSVFDFINIINKTNTNLVTDLYRDELSF